MAVKISQDNVACIGCGACVAICPSDWKLEGDKAILVGGKKEGKLFVKTVKDAGCSKDAENACPVRCIKVQ
ncbi:MAG: ferredoxin [Candidatus Diapherotrites archaeon]|nr:ferredoxin [Candidatus Diapherotrites archaeon]